MACELWLDKLNAFVDGELSAEAQRELDVHLRTCTSCAAEIAGHAQLKSAVKRAASRRYVPSAEFRRRIESQVPPRKRGTRTRFAWTWAPALGLAAAILLAAVWLARRPAGTGAATIGELVDMHAAALASANPVDVISTDQHTVKPWFEGKLPFAVDLPDLTKTEFTLLGGRVTYLGQSAGAGLLFQFRKHRLSAFVFQDRSEWRSLGAGSAPERQASFWVETWSAAGLRYFVVGDTSGANVAQLSNLMKSAADAE
ncbi:MAG TPA: zf-HC2 domain-containing protein [Candidatus Acidoferrales bacterium]|nr:zf-HC2 domain-containing protein [Candidatus Acidoferrales bacterium]